jgi:hypothetical protein
MQIFLLQAASQLDRAGCLFLAVLHRTISLPSTAFWLGCWLAQNCPMKESFIGQSSRWIDLARWLPAS